jgi:hypothetical protein
MSNVKFIEEGHVYKSLDDKLTYTSVTTLINKFKPKFDKSIAYKLTTNKKSKWYGIPPLEIQKIWENEGLRSTTDGTLFHNAEEEELLKNKFWRADASDVLIPVIATPMVHGVKYSQNQILTNGLYPEFIVYILSKLVAGQVDKLFVVDGYVYIDDYKTNKEIKLEGYRSWDGTVDKLLGIMSHLDNCEFNIYALQLSIYMYIILRHNRKLKFGRMRIEHIKFEIESEDIYSYPTYSKDKNGVPIVKSREFIEVPYLEKEVQSILNQIK